MVLSYEDAQITLLSHKSVHVAGALLAFPYTDKGLFSKLHGAIEGLTIYNYGVYRIHYLCIYLKIITSLRRFCKTFNLCMNFHFLNVVIKLCVEQVPFGVHTSRKFKVKIF